MNWFWKLMLAFAITNLFACGSGKSIPKTPGGPDSAPVISVQLNDLFNQEFPSEAVQLSDARRFAAPLSISVVGGTYAGSNPSQYLHARLLVGAETCEYQANGINLTLLTLQFCTGGVEYSTQLPAGTVIELVNYDAPGLLLEVHFNLVR